jgi:hypothetical protein
LLSMGNGMTAAAVELCSREKRMHGAEQKEGADIDFTGSCNNNSVVSASKLCLTPLTPKEG